MPTINCLICGKPKEHLASRIASGNGKFCSRGCSQKHQRGRKLPHSKEWEARRLEAVKLAMSNKVFPRGYSRPKSATRPMIDALARKMKEDPEKYRRIATDNLPKEVTGEKNGNWKGGITVKNRGIRFSSEMTKWRKRVFSRDGGKCRICGTTDHIQVHHIIPVSECPSISTVDMNGVCLCRLHHYENDEAWQGKRFNHRKTSGNTLALIFTIPHKFQAYETVGNWAFAPDGAIVIFVSRMSDWRYEALVCTHELVEVGLCKMAGITQRAVDEFDLAFEAARPEGNTDEPGDDPSAPYHRQHCTATGIERTLAAALDVSWSDYDKEINALSRELPI